MPQLAKKVFVNYDDDTTVPYSDLNRQVSGNDYSSSDKNYYISKAEDGRGKLDQSQSSCSRASSSIDNSYEESPTTKQIPDGEEEDKNNILRIIDGRLETKQEVDEETSSPVKELDIDVYKTRFWILGLFSYVAFVTILIWGTFGPIMESAKYAYGWQDRYIALLDGWGPLSSILCMIPFNWTAQNYGLRKGMLLATTLIAASAGVRCITVNDTSFTYLASVAAILDGMGSCLTLSLPAMLSSTWFPMNERATATAVGALATQLGGAGMYFSPLVVRTPNNKLTKDDIKGDIRTLMYIHFGMAAFGFICTLIYFPEKPPKPPSVSSSVERINYFESIKLVIRNPQVMLVVATYIFSMAIPFSWVSVMDFSLGCLGISQAMWIAITACTVSPFLAFLVARVTDHLYGYLKISIVGLLFGASCFFFWFLLMTEKIITTSLVQMFIAIVFAISLQYSSVPLLIELAVELAYPCPESVVGALLTFSMDCVDASFLLLLMIPSHCFRWVSFILVACCSLTIIPMIFVQEIHRRSDLDQDPSDSQDRSV